MTLWANVRYSARSLARTPVQTLTLVVTIALGIGSNAAIVGFVRGLVTRDVPLAGIDSIVSTFARGTRDSFDQVSYGDYLALKGRGDLFASLGAGRESRVGATIDGRATVLSQAAITPEFAALLGLSLRDGIVISHRVWQSEYDGAGDVRGRRIRADGTDYRIHGIAPDWLEGIYADTAVDLWVPLQDDGLGEGDGSRVFWTIGRLARGVSAARAQDAVNATRSGAEAIAVLPYTGMTPEVAGGMRRISAVLASASGAVFFIACVNVATFLLSRSSARSRETSVRVAIGATRRQLAAQVLADSMLISLAGAAFGLLLARWTLDIIPSLLFDRDAERLVLAPDTRGIVMAAVACAAVTIACGMMPLLEMRRDDPAAVLQRESAGPSQLMQRVRAALVIAQMTCCCLLIVSMLALMTGFRAALENGVGRQLHGSILTTVQPQFRFERPDLGFKYYRDIETAAMSVPAITTAAWSSLPPGSRPGWQSVRVEPPQLPVHDVVMNVVAFTPQSVRTIVTPPLAGRMFTAGDRPESCRVAIVNDVAATEIFEGDAVARAIEDSSGQRAEIVGVVAERLPGHAAAPAPPRIYYYAEQGDLPPDRMGPARFRVPVRQTLATGVLETLVVSSAYFTALGVSPVAGRVFEDEPAGDACRVGVINEEAARLYFGGNAVGGALIDGAGNRTEVIGVVHVPPIGVAQRRPEAALYLPMSQNFLSRMTLILGARAGSDRSDAALRSVRMQLDQVKGGFDSPFVTTLDAHLAAIALAPQRIAVVLVSASVVIALVLAVLGLYGAMSEAARHRRREMAVRLALGAQAWRILRQVLWEGARLALAGAAAGTLGALLVIRSLARVTPGAGVPSLWAWLFAPAVLLAAVAIASVLPARQALATDPLAVMQRE